MRLNSIVQSFMKSSQRLSMDPGRHTLPRPSCDTLHVVPRLDRGIQHRALIPQINRVTTYNEVT